MPPIGENTSNELSDWLAETGHQAVRIEPLAGDVSARHYDRILLETGGTVILARYPVDLRETCSRFLTTTDLLQGAEVPAPRVLAADCTAGRMLLEDAGERTLYDSGRDRDWESLVPYYRRALALADSIAAIEPGSIAALNPPLDSELLRRELEQTLDVLLHPRGLAGDEECAADLETALDELCIHLGERPLVTCHRDFMARNLIPVEPAPGLLVIDHQDLRLGPPFYDTASLLNDSLFPPLEVEERLLDGRIRSAADRADYSRAVIQRTLKAAGTFETFAKRGNARYRPLIRPALTRAAKHLAELPETAPLATELGRLWCEIDLLD